MINKGSVTVGAWLAYFWAIIGKPGVETLTSHGIPRYRHITSLRCHDMVLVFRRHLIRQPVPFRCNGCPVRIDSIGFGGFRSWVHIKVPHPLCMRQAIYQGSEGIVAEASHVQGSVQRAENLATSGIEHVLDSGDKNREMGGVWIWAVEQAGNEEEAGNGSRKGGNLVCSAKRGT